MNTTSTPAGLTAVPAYDRLGDPCLGVPLAGRRGAGKLALLDPYGLDRLQAAGARALRITGDGSGRDYVVFHRAADRRLVAAARIITGAPIGCRVEHLNGDRLDLRLKSLLVRKYARAGAGRPGRSAAR